MLDRDQHLFHSVSQFPEKYTFSDNDVLYEGRSINSYFFHAPGMSLDNRDKLLWKIYNAASGSGSGAESEPNV